MPLQDWGLWRQHELQRRFDRFSQEKAQNRKLLGQADVIGAQGNHAGNRVNKGIPDTNRYFFRNLLACFELEYGHGMIFSARLQLGRRETGMVGRIGKMLRFKTKS